MKPTSIAVARFIEDFNLLSAEGIVNFIADIELKYNNKNLKIKSEVFIISVNPKNVDSIHLLNTDISELNFPVMFQSGREVFSNIDGVCLIVIGNNAENGDYVVSIFPERPLKNADEN